MIQVGQGDLALLVIAFLFMAIDGFLMRYTWRAARWAYARGRWSLLVFWPLTICLLAEFVVALYITVAFLGSVLT